MTDLLTYKHYSRFVVDYLCSLLYTHQSKIRDKKIPGRIVYTERFLKVLDTVFVQATGLNKEMQNKLVSQYPLVKVRWSRGSSPEIITNITVLAIKNRL